MNKKTLAALSLLCLLALVFSVGSIGKVRAQDPSPTSIVQTATNDAVGLMLKSPQQSASTTGTQRGTAMSYQGQLQKSGGVYNGTCNIQFSLWDAVAAGTQVGSTIAKNNVSVANGLFSVELDFGDQFKGEARWLQAAVQCTGDGGITTLAPRQPMNAVPYALGLWPGVTVRGSNASANFTAENLAGAGLAGYSHGTAGNSWGIFGQSDNSIGVHGYSVSGFAGVFGNAPKGDGVRGTSNAGDHAGVYGYNGTSEPRASGVSGVAPNGNGVFGGSTNFAGGYFYSEKGNGIFAASGTSYAAYFDGKMRSSVVEIAGGSDLAERFNMSNAAKPDPGTLVVIDEVNPGHLRLSNSAYDAKVAGIVSGAGGVKPGLTLHQDGVMDGDTQVAIAGRVYVKATASNGAIKPGDLLTTSDIPGTAMKASDDTRSHGAVIGKAMTGLKDGRGLVLVLVNLQ